MLSRVDMCACVLVMFLILFQHGCVDPNANAIPLQARAFNYIARETLSVHMCGKFVRFVFTDTNTFLKLLEAGRHYPVYPVDLGDA